MERFVPRIELRVLIAIKKRHNLVQNPANRRNTIILTIIPAVLILSLIALISVNCESSIANLSFELKKGKCCFWRSYGRFLNIINTIRARTTMIKTNRPAIAGTK